MADAEVGSLILGTKAFSFTNVRCLVILYTQHGLPIFKTPNQNLFIIKIQQARFVFSLVMDTQGT